MPAERSKGRCLELNATRYTITKLNKAKSMTAIIKQQQLARHNNQTINGNDNADRYCDGFILDDTSITIDVVAASFSYCDYCFDRCGRYCGYYCHHMIKIEAAFLTHDSTDSKDVLHMPGSCLADELREIERAQRKYRPHLLLL